MTEHKATIPYEFVSFQNYKHIYGYLLQLNMIRVIIVLAAIIPVTASSQIISLQNTYRQNDLQAGRQIDFPQFNTVGTDIVWDVSELMNDNDDDYTVRYDGVAGMDDELIAVTEQDTRYTYCIKDNSLLVCGFENRISKVNYDLKECYLRFPMFYGDSIEGYFHGVGRYCDRLSLRHFGKYKTKVEGKGCVVIADGDTLKNVTCLHTERVMSSQLSDIALADSLPVYSEDSIAKHLISDTDLIRTDIFRWYVDGYRYPIIETRTRRNASGDDVLASVAYYYPPSGQDLLTNQPADKQVKAYTRGGIGTDTKYGGFQDEEVFTWQQPYSLTMCDDGQHAILKYQISTKSMLSYTLYSLNGYMLAQCAPQFHESGVYTELINLQGTGAGVYLLDLYLGDEHQTKKLFLR